MVSFPPIPNVGDQVSANGATWEWDGVRWVAVSVGSSAGLEDAPGDGGYYVRRNGEWVAITIPVTIDGIGA